MRRAADRDGVIRVPRWLDGPEPGWTTSADVIVVGSGIAGLTAALRLREQQHTVLLVTKTLLTEGSTAWAQGGIAAALDPADSPREHLHDTLVAGCGICELDSVTALVNEGPARVRELVALGAEFDRDSDGEILLTREGGHHRDRIAHAGGDATGKEITAPSLRRCTASRPTPASRSSSTRSSSTSCRTAARGSAESPST